MPKINFSKVEKSFDKALQKLIIDRLSELAEIADVIQDPEVDLSNKSIEDIVLRFQKELRKLKKKDVKLYEKLELTPEDEKRFTKSSKDFGQDDWKQLRALKIKIDDLKRELYGDECINEENDKQIMKERRRHVNKRFNIREGWLPLH